MEWNNSTVEKLRDIFKEKYHQMFSDVKFDLDRKNRSALWNKYLKNYDAKVIRNDMPGKKNHAVRAHEILLTNFINTINFQNEVVTNSIVIGNPDRFGQYLLVPRDMAEKILVIGMI